MTVDHGWAWIVMGANIVISYLVGILSYSTGIINVALLDRFQADVMTTSWASGIIIALRFLGAPLSTLVVHNFGCRTSVMMGGFLLFAGCTASTFASTIWHIFFAYGLVGGFGVALVLQPVLLSVVFYFQKYRGVVSGVCQCGMSVGILTGPRITQKLLDTFGLSGMFLLLGAIQLNIVPMGALFRPTEHEGKQLKKKQRANKSVQVSADDSSTDTTDAKSDLQNLANGRKMQSTNTNIEDCHTTAATSDLKTSALQKEYAWPVGCINEAFVVSETKEDFDKVVQVTDGNCVESFIVDCSTTEVKSETNSHAHAALKGYNSNVSNNKEQSITQNGTSFCVAFTDEGKGDESSIPRDSTNHFLHELRPLTSNWAYIIHVTGVMFFMVAQSGIVLHLPQYVRSLGTSATDTATLFVGYGVLSIASRLLAGVLTTGDRLSPLTVCTAIFALGGLSTALFPLYAATYVGQIIFTCLIGSSTGGYFPLINLLAVELVGVELFAVALGAQGIFMGVGYTAGPPLAGLIVDCGGTYKYSFLFLGLSLCLATVCNVVAKIILWRSSKKSDCWTSCLDSTVSSPEEDRPQHSKCDINSHVV